MGQARQRRISDHLEIGNPDFQVEFWKSVAKALLENLEVLIFRVPSIFDGTAPEPPILSWAIGIPFCCAIRTAPNQTRSREVPFGAEKKPTLFRSQGPVLVTSEAYPGPDLAPRTGQSWRKEHVESGLSIGDHIMACFPTHGYSRSRKSQNQDSVLQLGTSDSV
ncbi:hypothetical protein PG984_012901 [Apiospora sp. TS-2023a]